MDEKLIEIEVESSGATSKAHQIMAILDHSGNQDGELSWQELTTGLEGTPHMAFSKWLREAKLGEVSIGQPFGFYKWDTEHTSEGTLNIHELTVMVADFLRSQPKPLWSPKNEAPFKRFLKSLPEGHHWSSSSELENRDRDWERASAGTGHHDDFGSQRQRGTEFHRAGHDSTGEAYGVSVPALCRVAQ